ncbi:MAG: GerMN domain-containing protein [Thermomicrobiales bacterium]|nr:GerMN domain-containing protein [Thermomicrobiales bacterium]
MSDQRRSTSRWRVLMVCGVILLLGGLLAACGSDGDEATATSPIATSTTAAAATEEPIDEPTEEPTEEPATEAPAEPTSTTPAAEATLPPTEPTATVAGSADMLTLSIYFIRDEKIALAHRTVPHTLQVAGAAMQELLTGPSAEEQAAGMSTSVPDGTRLLGVTISDDNIATVDLSGEFESGGGSLSMAARLAQVTYTLTQFSTIESVVFSLDGQPVDVFGGEGIILDHPVARADFEDLTPAIFVDTVAIGDRITSPVRLAGTANTFEATFQIQILAADGTLVVDQFATATSGTGTRGTFDISVPFDITPGPATVVVFEYSAKDGSPINVVEIPVIVAE